MAGGQPIHEAAGDVGMRHIRPGPGSRQDAAALSRRNSLRRRRVLHGRAVALRRALGRRCGPRPLGGSNAGTCMVRCICQVGWTARPSAGAYSSGSTSSTRTSPSGAYSLKQYRCGAGLQPCETLFRRAKAPRHIMSVVLDRRGHATSAVFQFDVVRIFRSAV